MQIADILTVARIKAPLQASTKQGVIEELLDLLVANGDIAERGPALQAVLDRERTRTTGIGSGLAVPHGKTAAVKKLIMAMGKPAAPIDFDSVDAKPVTLVLLLLSPIDQVGPHIQALAHISRLMSIDALRRKLEDASSPQQILKTILDKEKEEA